MNCGIYTLANDTVYDQFVALLNSIEANAGKDIPICVIPYDGKLEKVKEELGRRKNATLFNNKDSLDHWDNFARKVWDNYPGARWSFFKRNLGYYQMHTIRKLCSFDGFFEEFVYCDSDNLIMKKFDDIFEKLHSYDFVFDDWEHAKAGRGSLLNIEKIRETRSFDSRKIEENLHGSDFFASKKSILNKKNLEEAEKTLLKAKEIDWLPEKRFWDDVPLFCYLTLKTGRSVFNFTCSEDPKLRTGSVANSDRFVDIDHVLYNFEGNKPVHRIHYMGYSGADFELLCKGINRDIPYKDVFLYYRFIKDLKEIPKKFRSINVFESLNVLFKKLARKLKKIADFLAWFKK